MLRRLLARGHVRTRWRRYAVLGLVFLLGLGSFFGTWMVLEGARDSLIAPLAATLTGDVRITNETGDLGAGRIWQDYRPIASRVQRLGATAVAARYESNYITIRAESLQNWSAGLLVGIDPATDPAVADHAPYLRWGHALMGDYAYAPDGHAHVPLVLGTQAAKRLSLSLNASGAPDFSRPLTITSGHTVGSGSPPIPVTLEAVVVGLFQTGLEPLDKFTAYIPIVHARYLAGFAENDPVANTILASTGDADALARVVRGEPGLHAVTAEKFAFDYMGSMLLVLYVAGGLGLALFLVGLLVWVAHETGSFVRRDQAVLCSLRAIGVPAKAIVQSYAGLTVAALAAGGVAAFLLALVVPHVAPPIAWSLSGLEARISLTPRPLGMLLVMLGATLAAFATSFLVARRIGRLNILTGLRRA